MKYCMVTLLGVTVSLVMLTSCIVRRPTLEAGEFAIDLRRSGFEGAPGEGMGAVPQSKPTVNLFPDGRAEISGLISKGHWSASESELVITAEQYFPPLAFFEEIPPKESQPVTLKMKISGPNELLYYPTKSKVGKPFVLIYVRK